MIGYGMAKAAVHQLVKSLASEKSGLPDKALAVALLPITLDTPMNRKFMPKVTYLMVSHFINIWYIASFHFLFASGRLLYLDKPGVCGRALAQVVPG